MKVEGPLFDSAARILSLTGEVDHGPFMTVADQLLRLDTHGAKLITLYVSCRGGSWIEALLLTDIMGGLRSPVRAIGMGFVEGAGTIILACARERIILPGCILSASGLDQFPVNQATSLLEALQPRIEALRQKCPGLGVILQSDKTGRIVSAREAVRLGLADRVYGDISPGKAPYATR